MESDIAFYGIITVVGVAIFTSLGTIWYRLGRAVTHNELTAAMDRINARFDHTDELIINTANQLRAEMAANRAEFRAEMADIRAEFHSDMAANRAEMAANRAEFSAELSKIRTEMRQEMRQAVVDLAQAVANHRHEPDGRVSVMMVAEPQSAYETNRPAQ